VTSIGLEPLVSIILPTYNGDRYLAASIESCLLQTYRNIELVVVVDGSTDETRTVLAQFTDPRLSIVFQQVNKGLPHTLNTGFAQSQGQLLTWTSDDNRFAPQAIERMLRFLQANPQVDFVYADFWRIDDEDRITEESRVGVPAELYWRNPVGYCFLYRREIYAAIGGYDPATRLAEDIDYWMRVFRQFNMQRYSERLYYYRVHEKSLTMQNYGRYESLRIAARSRRKWLQLNWRRYVIQIANANIEEAFARFRDGDIGQVWLKVMLGIAYNPLWLLNRGVISILLRSVAGVLLGWKFDVHS
jgi:glycosyltransferase involved in cell wall biosynthesis